MVVLLGGTKLPPPPPSVHSPGPPVGAAATPPVARWWGVGLAEGSDGPSCGPLPLHATELDESGDALPEVIAVEERLEALRIIAWQRADLGVGARLVEERNREALPRAADHAVLGGADAAAAPAPEPRAEIHRQRPLERRHVEPRAVAAAGLESRHAVLGEQRQKSGVGVRSGG